MLTIQRYNKNHDYDHFYCSTYRKKKKGLCTPHRIRVNDLKEVILQDLRKICEYVAFHEKEFIENYLKFTTAEQQKSTGESQKRII